MGAAGGAAGGGAGAIAAMLIGQFGVCWLMSWMSVTSANPAAALAVS